MSERADHSRPRSVPSVADLRPVAQGAKTEADRRWTYRAFRAVSIYLTWALLHTRVTPNQVTVFSLLVAGIGLVLVALPTTALAVTGCVLLLVYHLLDRVDGEVARYRKHYSLLGVYLDNAGHYITGGGLLIAASFRLADSATDPRIVWLIGSVGAMAAIMSRIEKHASYHLFAQYVMKSPDLVDTVTQGSGPLTKQALEEIRGQEDGAGPSFLSVIGDVILTLTWFPITVVMLFGGFVADAAGLEGAALVMLYVVAGLQIVGYLGVEFANLSGNLGSETSRLRSQAEAPRSEGESR